MYTREVLAEILTAWLRINFPIVWDMEWLVHWFAHPNAQDQDSQDMLRVLERLPPELQGRFVERMIFSLVWVSNRGVLSQQLLFHILILAKGVKSSLLVPSLVSLNQREIVCGEWHGHSLKRLLAEALRVSERVRVSA